MTVRGWALAALIACIVLLDATTGYADGMYCGTRIARRGDTTYQVGAICGEPHDVRKRVEYRTVQELVRGPCYGAGAQFRCGHVITRTVEVVIDEWVYDFGPTRLVRHLLFEQGRLLRIETGGYGQK